MVREMWTDDPGWRPIQVESTALQMIAHLTAGVFAGRQLCRDREWIDITIQYSMTAMVASEQLWRWPGWTRRLAARILPSCRLLSAQVQRADELAMAASQTRKNEAATTREVRTEQSTSYHDGLEWMEECARGRPYRPGVAQLSVTLGAVGTTKDLLMQVLYDTAGKDDLMDALREEIIAVVSEHGWTKAAIPNLQLMDSMIKESQRLKPVGITGIRRTPATDIHLSEGGIVPKGVPFEISNMHMWADADLYPNPRSFQADRFLRLRRVSGHEATAQLASMSADHLGWGLGRNACPARFFVAMEVKVLLCHLILKYDWTLEDGCLPEVRRYGTFLSADPEGKLLVRRRREEIDLDGALV
ncbi:cytochrome P450 monooxygenase [Aspergillus taichungensis]|uniref:Cytochrome P450 monooxygenase n=1 Tax=Aspergillus taichungensis TaxID=482145 RepID=A0A2J5I5N9_9EURO|nr:cytochrome P450 monooxygenase [Aspergillus taichungensis]